jgi:hypothetical protein
MKYYMGHFGDVTIPSSVPAPTSQPVSQISYSGEPTLIATASDLASKSLESTFDKAAELAKAQEIQDFIKENNLGPYVKDLNRERVTNIFALMGFIWTGKLLKSPVGLALLGLGGAYLLYSNSDKLIENVSKKATLA